MKILSTSRRKIAYTGGDWYRIVLSLCVSLSLSLSLSLCLSLSLSLSFCVCVCVYACLTKTIPSCFIL